MLGASISKNSLLLGLFALVTAGILALTNVNTRDRIAEAERQAAEKALYELVLAERVDNDLLSDTLPTPPSMLAALGLDTPEAIHRARKDGQVIAVIVPAVAPDGYSGDIRIIVGVNRDGSVAGVRALSHKETPGLGDKVDTAKSDWVYGFNGKSLNDPSVQQWAVKKDGGVFDQFTGATITPRAVTAQVKRVLQQVDAQRALLFELPAEAGEKHGGQ
ncbi:electron transport complex subunit RsxG [Gilvimarinus agarilyticus]|uniref:electron transport complex subunit RsxG n=1 Tax=unclassified Gilvimarinus TaxID=2642066 RepID=UPI001C090EE0|nr:MULTISPECIES: electron transport complex subunit RsxG [unclassified Gilvimarinus]MBU2886885.1 electron transport complex subunit RsxG [Gilvimarinus agarilyticus]MDO6571546.1 electron transport complex subunit RsxG [Gilvimarinus sp. 2_MG-2023]MDO6747931.1 electron transport complex subunit RsxG [Gilvimarinus sp. 1_MG-2023]